MVRRSSLALLLVVAACRQPPPPDPAPAPAPTPEAAPAVPPAPPPPRALDGALAEAVAVEPGGRTVALLGDPQPVVDPGATFRLVLRGRFPDARLSLLDARDALVAFEGTREVGAATALTLTPSAPLAPAATYLVRVDGAAIRQVHDEAGQAYEPLTITVLVAGEPAPPPEKRPERRRRKR